MFYYVASTFCLDAKTGKKDQGEFDAEHSRRPVFSLAKFAILGQS